MYLDEKVWASVDYERNWAFRPPTLVITDSIDRYEGLGLSSSESTSLAGIPSEEQVVHIQKTCASATSHHVVKHLFPKNKRCPGKCKDVDAKSTRKKATIASHTVRLIRDDFSLVDSLWNFC